MKTTRMMLLFAVVTMLMTACASVKVTERKPNWVQFTTAILNNPDNKLSEQVLKDSCQFALGTVGATFERKIKVKETRFINGKMVTSDIEKIYRDTLRPLTPCILLTIDTSGLVTQSFGDSLILTFGPDEKGCYTLYGDGGENQVSYRGFSWAIVAGGNNAAMLNIDWEKVSESRKIGRTIPGVSIADMRKKK